MLNITAHPGKAHETEDDEEDNDEKEEKELAHGSAGPSTTVLARSASSMNVCQQKSLSDTT